MKKKKPKPYSEKPKKDASKKEHSSPEEEQKGFDFGGLPSRDLKKNLGCG
jgi:hypothetical protein